MKAELKKLVSERDRVAEDIHGVRKERTQMIHDLQAARRALSEANRKRGRGRVARPGDGGIRSPFAAVRSVGAQVIEIIDEDEPLEESA